MKLHNLTPAKGSTKREKRVGRGEGSGRGGQSTRGMNGAKSRSGYHRKLGFEGGQMPIQRRLPKFGFKNPNRVEYKAVNLSMLQALVEKENVTVVNFDTLIGAGLVSKNDKVKILGKGELKARLDVVADAFSKSAKEKIEALEGKAIVFKPEAE
ncbi:MAG TPA: 50S ribosomal protein L15 [Candidatus Coprenecus stercoripullorum]|nr:50S ribosomal protein L15 [Candidatus Coprenecus stercoripullorum]